MLNPPSYIAHAFRTVERSNTVLDVGPAVLNALHVPDEAATRPRPQGRVKGSTTLCIHFCSCRATVSYILRTCITYNRLQHRFTAVARCPRYFDCGAESRLLQHRRPRSSPCLKYPVCQTVLLPQGLLNLHTGCGKLPHCG